MGLLQHPLIFSYAYTLLPPAPPYYHNYQNAKDGLLYYSFGHVYKVQLHYI
jgi:hypothetical protein